ncbi:MAG TPA: HutD family protein [Noviherbaspirillum sp.]|uniref:HutD/Ves family protein n=1 Tax=Noviherbaspirillum sp. TaxID=1926288 RepID=UPI002D6D7BC2|nr:HutD family protein [Noviherbaspirillum sp.]HYD97586.1 HutD family protein [Noviherbaspirillum sp.]
MRKLSAADYLVMPWKNGGGTTTQLAVGPAGADLEQFDWRISSARVCADGPFSPFPGVDRSLAVLDGAGLALAAGGTAPVLLRPGAAPFRFRGEQQIDAFLADGPVSDFNVMTRRDRCMHELQLLELDGSLRLAARADLLLAHLVSGAGLACRDARGDTLRCGPGDTILIDSANAFPLEFSTASPARLCLASIRYKET